MNLENALEKLREAVVAWGPDVVAAVAILVLGWFGAKIITGLVRRSLARANADPMLVRFLASVVYIAVMALVVIAVLGRLGVNTTSFAAVIAAAGLAIGLAFQGSLSNFAAGALLIFFRPFKVGDYVEAGGVGGTVQEVQVFTTVLNTPDNKRVVVGNAAVMGGTITNYSANDKRRVDLVFGVGYGDDLRRARDIIERVLSEEKRILTEPAPTVAIAELADSSVNFVVRPWVATDDYWSVYFALTEKIKLAFDEAGVSIPFPQRDVHLHTVNAA